MNKIVMGCLTTAYGIKGWHHLVSFTHPLDNIFSYPHWQIQQNNRWCTISFETYQKHADHFIVKLTGCNDRDAALRLKNTQIAVDRSDLPTTRKNEYYWEDLVGLTIVDLSGKKLGVVDYLLKTGANDVIVTTNPVGKMIPCIPTVIKNVDLEKKIIRADWDWADTK